MIRSQETLPAGGHLLQWDEAASTRFHDFAAHWPAWHDHYFAKKYGEGLLTFAQRVMDLSKDVLDYGCGFGFLVEKMLDRNIPCQAVDLSPESVDLVNRKCHGKAGWGGAKVSNGGTLPYASGTFESIFCIEIIEHVLDEHMAGMLKELRRVLKPETGRLLITTPHNEQLERNYVMCPESGSVFHRMQHVSSFTVDSLSALMALHGFEVEQCDVTNFQSHRAYRLPHPLDWSPRRLWGLARETCHRTMDAMPFVRGPWGGYRMRALTGAGPHLWCLLRARD